MEKTNEILTKILEELQINGTEFQQKIVIGELVKSGIWFLVNLVVFIIAIKLFKRLNEELYLKENIMQILECMKNYKNTDFGYKKKEEKERKFEEEPFMEMYQNFKAWISKAPIHRIIITLFLLYIEIKSIFFFATKIISYMIVVINCFVAHEKVVLDYLANLF